MIFFHAKTVKICNFGFVNTESTVLIILRRPLHSKILVSSHFSIVLLYRHHNRMSYASSALYCSSFLANLISHNSRVLAKTAWQTYGFLAYHLSYSIGDSLETAHPANLLPWTAPLKFTSHSSMSGQLHPTCTVCFLIPSLLIFLDRNNKSRT